MNRAQYSLASSSKLLEKPNDIESRLGVQAGRRFVEK